MRILAPYVLHRGQTKRWISVPRINWAHPMAQGLEFYGYDIGNGVIVDLVRGRRPNLVGTRDALGTTQFGPGIKYNLDGNQNFASDAGLQTTPTALSFACAFTQTGAVGSFARAFGRTANNGGSSPFANWDFEVNPSGAGQNTACCNFSIVSGHTQSNNWTGNANNIFSSVLCTISGGLNFVYYAQGVVIQSAPANSNYLSVNTQDAVIFSGDSAAAATSPFAGFVHYGAYWLRTLSAQEALKLYLDPYCFLIYPQDEMWARRVGATGVTPPATVSVLYSLNNVW